ncbi:hypothetical protein [Asanoa iriomotensis]|uniref:Uncharacterized protein n=1 Tax=Asanoa iriomotensis TaxID=234613 RepID=A0ABQ4CAP2_9ACTN|nr:hypothetical protein [Asanoa iriomotensis]GIF59833.1 hypothetical protein Air01nite_59280 [Asanoa iriomotensis]
MSKAERRPETTGGAAPNAFLLDLSMRSYSAAPRPPGCSCGGLAVMALNRRDRRHYERKHGASPDGIAIHDPGCPAIVPGAERRQPRKWGRT